MSDQTIRTTVDPTWTWGSSAVAKVSNALGLSQGQQLAQVTLPEPAVCSLYLQASMTTTDPTASILRFTLNLNTGLGRVTIPRTIVFNGQPSNLAILQWTEAFVPLHTINVDTTIEGDFPNGTGEVDVQMYFAVAPITRIPQKIQKLQFGMATPGEADSMDDELLENLEEEAPSVAEIMGHEADQRNGVHHEDHGGHEPQGAPAWMLDLVDALSSRLGRAPKRAELRAAVQRLQQRAARKAKR